MKVKCPIYDFSKEHDFFFESLRLFVSELNLPSYRAWINVEYSSLFKLANCKPCKLISEPIEIDNNRYIFRYDFPISVWLSEVNWPSYNINDQLRNGKQWRVESKEKRLIPYGNVKAPKVGKFRDWILCFHAAPSLFSSCKENSPSKVILMIVLAQRPLLHQVNVAQRSNEALGCSSRPRSYNEHRLDPLISSAPKTLITEQYIDGVFSALDAQPFLPTRRHNTNIEPNRLKWIFSFEFAIWTTKKSLETSILMSLNLFKFSSEIAK